MAADRSRRDFIKTLAAATAGVSLAPTLGFPQRRRGRCVVIGAGLAGLAAAYKLKNAGWTVTVMGVAYALVGFGIFAYAILATQLLSLMTFLPLRIEGFRLVTAVQAAARIDLYITEK